MRRSMLALATAGIATAAFLSAGAPPAARVPAPGPPSTGQLDAVVPNDNRVPAGTLRDDSLFVRLEVRLAEWRPEGDSGPARAVEALAEEGKPPTIPGPLLRVPEGTTIVATVTNRLADSTVILMGLAARPSAPDSVPIAPGAARTVTFAAGRPGTYLYRVRIGQVAPVAERDLTAGAFIVDPRGARPDDRVLVINIWGTPLDSIRYDNALAINGRSWPHTERFAATVGDTLRWRVLNASARPHPMHLHGAYFRVEGKGDGWADTTYAPAQQRLAVTEVLDPGQSMRMAWAPVEPGRWVFHCHLTFHVVAPEARLAGDAPASHEAHDEDPRVHMAGLVIGIDAAARVGARVAPRRAARTLDLYVQEGARRARSPRSLAYVLQRGARPPAPDSVAYPSSLLVLTRGEATDVRVHNRLREPTAVHWHGLELESYSDGVAGLSGPPDGMPAPAIAPGATFTAHLSTPRAGTFIYHTHLRDVEQLTSGLYGPLLVLEPGERFDPRTDHVVLLGWDDASDPQLLINGDSLTGPPLAMRVGESHRLRFINIGASAGIPFALLRDTVPAEWTPIAKDGADLPAAQRVPRPARLTIDVGETYDFVFTPREAGTYALTAPSDPKGRMWRRTIEVR